MAYRKVSDISLRVIAGAILNKTGGQNGLQFPEDFVSAIQSIATGGSFPLLTNQAGSGQILETYSAYSHDGSVVPGGIKTKTASGNFIITPSTPNYAKSFDAGYYPNAHGHYVQVDTTKQNITLTSVPKEILSDSSKFMTRAVITGLGGDIHRIYTTTFAPSTATHILTISGFGFKPVGAMIALQAASTTEDTVISLASFSADGAGSNTGFYRYGTSYPRATTKQLTLNTTNNSVTATFDSAYFRGVYAVVVWGRD